MKKSIQIIALLTLWLAFVNTGASGMEKEYDVVVYGGTVAGTIAAIAAAREGASVAILEPGEHLGGMVSGGLGATDAGRVQSIGGIALEYFTRLGEHYERGRAVFRHQLSAAEALFDEMLEEADVDLYFSHRLIERDGIEMSGSSIQRVLLENGAVFRGRVFIDASYEADLMAQAGVSYHVGRESRDTYGEPVAGRRELHYYDGPEIAYDDEGLLPDIYEGDPGEPGNGDCKIQSYNFRLCLTRDAENRVAIEKPEKLRSPPLHVACTDRDDSTGRDARVLPFDRRGA